MSFKRHAHSASLRLLFIESVSDFGGGSERVSHDLAIALSRSGHRVFFAVPREGTALASLRDAGVHCIIADIGPLPLSRPLLSLRRWFAAASLVSQIDPDHTFTSVSYLAPLLGSLQAVFGRASAVHLGLFLNDVPPTLRWAMRLGVLGVAPSTWAMNAWSQRGWPSVRLARVSNGVNLIRFRPRDDERASLRARIGWNENEIVIVFIGRLTPEKGVPTLVRAFATVAREAPQARLALFGHASEEILISLRTLAKKHDVSESSWAWHGPTSEPE
jgi:glycosyltransferase involved in cell wall biosynthesis